MGVRVGLSPSEIQKLTPSQIINIAEEREKHADIAKIRNAQLIAIAHHKPEKLKEILQDALDDGEKFDGVGDIDGLLTMAKAAGFNVVVEELVE